MFAVGSLFSLINTLKLALDFVFNFVRFCICFEIVCDFAVIHTYKMTKSVTMTDQMNKFCSVNNKMLAMRDLDSDPKKNCMHYNLFSKISEN